LVELDKANIELKLLSSELSFDDSKMFKELMGLYPWCSSFKVAYLKALKTKNDLRFSSELEKYAVELNSRSVLYDLTRAFVKEKSESVSEKKPEQMEKTSEIVDKVEDVVTQETPNKLDQLIESEAVAAQVLNDLKETIVDLDVGSEQETRTSVETPLSIEFKRIDIEAPRTFNDWLTAGSLSDNVEDKKEFLTFEKPKVPFFSPVKKAKESLGIENLPVSETLAKVFESQGNYAMAKTTYEQLILIFPEKKSFFADQIQNLNNKTI
jgi:hypothetical protein